MNLTVWRGAAVLGLLVPLALAAAGPATTAARPAAARYPAAGRGGNARQAGQPWTAAQRTCPLLIAHQGYTGAAAGRGPVPADSAAAVRDAVRHGAAVVEFDVRWSRDGVPVVIHDPTVNATTRQRGRVDGYAARTLTRMRLRTRAGLTGDFLPRLKTVLRVVASLRIRAVAEIKIAAVTPAQVAAFNAVVATTRTGRLVSVHGFYRASLAKFAGRPLTLLTATPVTSAPGFAGVDMRGSIVTPALVASLRAAGLVPGAYTSQGSGVSDTAATWARLAKDGVARIITNDTPGYRQWCAGWARAAAAGR